MKVLAVVGTRPEAIKMAPVIQELKRNPNVQVTVCATGQHESMLQQVLVLFEIVPDFFLNVMTPDQPLAALTSALLIQLDPVIKAVTPDWIIAQGDTTSTLAAAMISFYNRIPFAHVEAGLRTNDITQPFPEEANRRIIDALSSLLFAPTLSAYDALSNENFALENIYVTGNTVIDALRKIEAVPYEWSNGPLASIPENADLVLVTCHRRENFGKPIQDLCTALIHLVNVYPNIHFIYSVHLNPNVKESVESFLNNLPNVHLIAPLDYLSFVNLMKRSILILTDSGGIQEEAPTFGIPVFVLRNKTERPEGVISGHAKIIGTDPSRIITEVISHMAWPSSRKKDKVKLYGDGHAAKRIAYRLCKRASEVKL